MSFLNNALIIADDLDKISSRLRGMAMDILRDENPSEMNGPEMVLAIAELRSSIDELESENEDLRHHCRDSAEYD